MWLLWTSAINFEKHTHREVCVSVHVGFILLHSHVQQKAVMGRWVQGTIRGPTEVRHHACCGQQSQKWTTQLGHVCLGVQEKAASPFCLSQFCRSTTLCVNSVIPLLTLKEEKDQQTQFCKQSQFIVVYAAVVQLKLWCRSSPSTNTSFTNIPICPGSMGGWVTNDHVSHLMCPSVKKGIGSHRHQGQPLKQPWDLAAS